MTLAEYISTEVLGCGTLDLKFLDDILDLYDYDIEDYWEQGEDTHFNFVLQRIANKIIEELNEYIKEMMVEEREFDIEPYSFTYFNCLDSHINIYDIDKVLEDLCLTDDENELKRFIDDLDSVNLFHNHFKQI